jgi:1-acyl-sn-glycerol-3-phosphate acyltransferase
MTWWQVQRRAPGWPRRRVLFWWTIVAGTIRLVGRVLYGARMRGIERIPRSGPVLYVANHQSHLDPPLIGSFVSDRPFAALARHTLFDGRLMGWMLRSIGVIPLDQESAGDIASMRTALRELQAGRTIIIFPEGSRSPDGAVHPFQRGVWLLLKRADATVLPIAIEGVWDVFPRGASRPRLRGRIAASIGTPTSSRDLVALGPDIALERLRREIETMRMDLRHEIRTRTGGRRPKPGAGDMPYWTREAEAPAPDAHPLDVAE